MAIRLSHGSSYAFARQKTDVTFILNLGFCFISSIIAKACYLVRLQKPGGAETMESPSSHTYVFNPESPTEMARLINQDHMLTQSMGGPFSGLPDISSLHNILDLGCGSGGWVLDAASALPDAKVKGVDISHIMVDYANAHAQTLQLS